MSLWLVLIITVSWLALCAMGMSLCVMASWGDRDDFDRLKLVPADRHTERRPLRMRSKSRRRAPTPR